MRNFIAVVVLMGTVSGCALAKSKYPNRAAVVMKISDTEAYVCMGVGEVNAGDTVALYRNACSTTSSKVSGPRFQCDKVKIGEGRITEALNEHYSVMKVEPGVRFEEGTTVERQR